MSRPFFDPITDHVIGLGKEDAVHMLHELIYAELARLKLHVSVISIPFEVDISDGGIDARLASLEEEPASEILFRGETYYQSKSGSSVKLNNSGLRDIVLADTKLNTKQQLKPKIKDIAEKNGNLVLFLPGISKPKIDEAEKSLFSIIKETVPSTTLRVKILQADNIVGILRPHFALKMRFMRGNTSFLGITYDIWVTEPSMSNHFEHDEKRDVQIKNIRQLLLSDEAGKHDVRVSGFPGNGKTRSVLEAVGTPELSQQVVYFEKPSHALKSGNLYELSLEDNIMCIVIVDECDTISYASILSIVRRSKTPIKLLTIFNEDGNSVTGDVRYVDLNTSEKLSENAIERIIESYNPIGEYAWRWAQYCDGSPRMAHMIGENFKYSSTDILKNPSYDKAMELCLANRDKIDSPEFNERKQVLMWLSLFTKFGWSKVHAHERQFILAKIKRLEGLKEGKVESIINNLKSRKILQGDKTLYISPRLLQIRAWKWWWELYAHTFDMEKFWQEKDDDGNYIDVSKALINWFNDMFQYADEAPGAAEVVKTLLSQGGPLENEEQLMTAIESSFFLRLTQANPSAALVIISHWIQSKSDKELEELHIDRQNLVRSLETMAVWREYFVEATRLMLRLARTETNHAYSNNSEGTFSDMFSNGRGKLAPTEAPPSERLIVLKEALESNNTKDILLGIQGINKSLETDYFTRSLGSEIQGLKHQPKLWMPETKDELWDPMQSNWDLLVAKIPTLKDKALDKALEVIDNRLRSLVRYERGMHFLNGYIRLTDEGLVPYEKAVETISIISRYEKGLGLEVKTRLEEFYAFLEGNDFPSNLRRYVSTNIFEDWNGSDKKTDTNEIKLKALAEKIVPHPILLSENLWLFTTDAKNGYRFGEILAEVDNNFVLLANLLIQQKKSTNENASIYFLSGYLKALQKQNPDKLYQLFDELKEDSYYLPYMLELIRITGLDEHTGGLVLHMLEAGKANYCEMACFTWGAEVKNISDELFDRLIKQLLRQNDVHIHAIAVTLFLSHYVSQEKKQIPKSLTKELLIIKTLGSQANWQISNDINWQWSQVAKRYIEQYPDDIVYLIDFIVKYYGKEGSILKSHYESSTVITTLAQLRPEVVWAKVASEIVNEYTYIGSWLKDGAIQLFDKIMVLEWIDKDPINRAPLVAYLVPHNFGLSNKPNEPCWLQIIIDRYGIDQRVVDAINSNLWTEGYSGLSSHHYAKKLEDIKHFKVLNKNSVNIQTWANDYISSLERQVERSKICEERSSF